MECLKLNMAPSPATRTATDLVEYVVEAPGLDGTTTDASLQGTRRQHAFTDDSGNTVWLAREFALSLSTDWLDGDDSDALDWCVLPMPASFDFAFPQSPSSVDCSSHDDLLAIDYVDMSDVKAFGVLPYMPTAEDRIERLSTRSKVLKVEATRDQRLDTKRQDAIKVQLVHKNRANAIARQEDRRRRQRAYERKYRSKRRTTRQRLFDEWVVKETEFDRLLAARAKSWRVNGTRPSLQQLVMEEDAIITDILNLVSLASWEVIFQLHIYNGPETLRTQEAWAAVHKSVLGAGAFKPFRPFHYTFEW